MDRIRQIKNNVAPQLEEIKSGAVLLEIKDKIAIISLNRPKSYNALAEEIVDSLDYIFRMIHHSNQIKVVILRSNFEKCFCAGANIKEFYNVTNEQWLTRDRLERVRKIVFNFEKPIIACVNNLALGGGFELALSCDIILANQGARFGFPEISLGLFPCLGGTLISKTIGLYRASELIFTGKKIRAEELFKLNIVNKVLNTKTEMDKEALNVAKEISKYSLFSLIQAKKALKFSFNESGRMAKAQEGVLFNQLMNMKSAKEGISAFVEKRKPDFSNF